MLMEMKGVEAEDWEVGKEEAMRHTKETEDRRESEDGGARGKGQEMCRDMRRTEEGTGGRDGRRGMRSDMRRTGAGDGVEVGARDGGRDCITFSRTRRMFMLMFIRGVATGGLGGGDQGGDCPLGSRGSVHCTCFRRGVEARRIPLLEEEVGRDEETGVGGVAGDGEGEGIEGGVAHSAHGHRGPDSAIWGNAGAGRRRNMGRRKTGSDGGIRG